MRLSEVKSSLQLPAGADFHGLWNLRHGKMLEVDDWDLSKVHLRDGPMSELVTPCIRRGGIELVYVSCLEYLESSIFATKCGTPRTFRGCACCSSSSSHYSYTWLGQWGFLIAISSNIGDAQPQPSPDQRSAMPWLPKSPSSYWAECQVPNVSVSYTLCLPIVAKCHHLVSSSNLQAFQHCADPDIMELS